LRLSWEEDEVIVKPSKSKSRLVLVTLALVTTAVLALPVAAAGRPPIYVTNYVSTLYELSPSGAVQPIVGDPVLQQATAVTTARNGQLLVHDRTGVVRVDPDSGNARHVASGSNVYWWYDLDQAPDTGFIYGASHDNPGTELGGVNGVVRVNPENGRTKVVARGRPFYSPSAIALARHGRIIYVKDVSPSSPGRKTSILRVNPRTGKVRRVLTSRGLGGPPWGMDYADGRLYLAVAASGHGIYASPSKIVRINPKTGARTAIASGLDVDNTWDLSVAANGDIYLASGAWVKRIKRGHHRAQILNQDSPFPYWLYGIVVGK
jgi:hypothetical protein